MTLAVVAAPAQAQNSLGVGGGYNIANLTFDPPIRRVYADAFGFDASSSGVNGLAAGIFFERPIGGRAGFRIEGLFSQAGTTIEGSASINGVDYTFEDKIKLSMLEVSVMVVFPLGIDHKVRLMGGGFLAFNLSQKETARETLGGEFARSISKVMTKRRTPPIKLAKPMEQHRLSNGRAAVHVTARPTSAYSTSP